MLLQIYTKRPKRNTGGRGKSKILTQKDWTDLKIMEIKKLALFCVWIRETRDNAEAEAMELTRRISLSGFGKGRSRRSFVANVIIGNKLSDLLTPAPRLISDLPIQEFKRDLMFDCHYSAGVKFFPPILSIAWARNDWPPELFSPKDSKLRGRMLESYHCAKLFSTILWVGSYFFCFLWSWFFPLGNSNDRTFQCFLSRWIL